VRNSLHELVEWPESQTYQEEVAQIYWVQAKRKTPAAAYKQLAAWYEAQGEVGAAIATYENATTLLADDPASYLALGLLQFDAGEIAASQAHFEQAVALDTTPKTYRAIQELYTSKLSPRRAASSLLYLLNQARPQLLQPYADLKAFYGALGDPSQDTAILQLAAEAMPDNDNRPSTTLIKLRNLSRSIAVQWLYALTIQPMVSHWGALCLHLKSLTRQPLSSNRLYGKTPVSVTMTPLEVSIKNIWRRSHCKRPRKDWP